MTVNEQYAKELSSIKSAVRSASIPLTSLSTLTSLYNFLSIGSFIFIWVPTAILLKTFSLRFGKIRYWLLVTIPVLYFLVPFFIDELGILDELRLQYGRQFNLL